MMKPALRLGCSVSLSVKTVSAQSTEVTSEPWCTSYEVDERLCQHLSHCDLQRVAPDLRVHVGECFEVELAVCLPAWEGATPPKDARSAATIPQLYYRLNIHPRRWLAVGPVQGPLGLLPGRPGEFSTRFELVGSRCGLLRLPSVSLYAVRADGSEEELSLLNAAKSEQILVEPSLRLPPPRIAFY